ncbi:F-box/kelch-repeat protein At3g23880-like [Medicago truncatula]|uniref:F-box/kelch-repeat protein At3g23880-like n=1 Tax=Medicago truncatula TaxID=3880 RepID=UPI001967BF61|nr:F-box/kelch-repeat protein At3g23880-like [Medicago truncatula]
MSPNLFLHDELIAEVLSFLPVKSLMKLRCVCKSWKTLISDSTFVKLHLQRSARNKHLSLFSYKYQTSKHFSVIPSPLRRLLENTSVTLADKSDFHLNKGGLLYVVGSCNGLLCLVGCLYNDNYEELGTIVAFHLLSTNDEVRVFTFGDNVWRNIRSLPDVLSYHHWDINHGVHVSGSLNWLAILMESQFVIISLDLSTESSRQLLLPQGFDKPTLPKSTLSVLMDSLCFCHDFHRTDFIIWQMKEFGAQESWTQFLKISYQSIQIDYNVISNSLEMFLFPLCLSENGGTLILACNEYEQAILYSLRDNVVEKTRITNKIEWSLSKDYVESLVSTG